MSILKGDVMVRIMADTQRVKETDKLFTDALIALESSEWDKCLEICNKIMDTSFSIEQRLAVMLLQGLCNAQNDEDVENYLKEAYTY